MQLCRNFGEACFSCAANANRYRVDEQSNHRFDTRHLSRTARHDTAKNDILSPVVVLEHDSPSRLQPSIQGHLVLLGDTVQAGSKPGSQFEMRLFQYILLIFSCGFASRQSCLLIISCQIAFPIFRCSVHILPSQPFDVPAVVRRVCLLAQLESRRLTCSRSVCAEQFICQLRQAPAVHQNMMGAPQYVAA